MRAATWLLGILAALLLATSLVMWAWAPWLPDADCMRLFGTGFVVLLAAAVCAAGAVVVWFRSTP